MKRTEATRQTVIKGWIHSHCKTKRQFVLLFLLFFPLFPLPLPSCTCRVKYNIKNLQFWNAHVQIYNKKLKFYYIVFKIKLKSWIYRFLIIYTKHNTAPVEKDMQLRQSINLNLVDLLYLNGPVPLLVWLGCFVSLPTVAQYSNDCPM